MRRWTLAPLVLAAALVACGGGAATGDRPSEIAASPARGAEVTAATVAPVVPVAAATTIPTAALPSEAPLPVVPPSAVPSPSATTGTGGEVGARGPIEVSRGPGDRRELAFTFDCGGHAGPTREILEILREADVSVTFFMIGDWVRAYPDLARDIAARHELAHHSDRHPDYPSLTDAQIIADLEAGERTFLEVTGRATRPLWRAPSGARDDRVLAAAARAGWPVHVFWTQERNARGELVTGDSGDWRPFTPQQVANNLDLAAELGNGVITVSHCDSEQTRLVLRESLEAIKARGLRIVTVSELLR